ncbi:MAG: hypothetical protein V2B14_01285 [bacterium]
MPTDEFHNKSISVKDARLLWSSFISKELQENDNIVKKQKISEDEIKAIETDDKIEADDKGYEKRFEAARCEAIELKNKDHKQDISFRCSLTEDLFKLTKWWILFIGFVVLLNGFTSQYKLGFHLSDNVMMALFGTMTVTIIGLFATVTGHFFNKKN